MMIAEICLKPNMEDKKMKTNRFFSIIFIIVTTIILSSFQTQQDYKVLFEKAVYTMETKADLKGAIDLFETLIKQYPDEKEYVAALNTVRLKGYAVDDGEFISGIKSISMSLERFRNLPLLMWVVGFSSVMPEEKTDEIIQQMAAIAKKVKMILN